MSQAVALAAPTLEQYHADLNWYRLKYALVVQLANESMGDPAGLPVARDAALEILHWAAETLERKHWSTAARAQKLDGIVPLAASERAKQQGKRLSQFLEKVVEPCAALIVAGLDRRIHDVPILVLYK